MKDIKKRILVVAAHPDDEVLGCGGTIAKLAAGGDKVAVLILGEGVTSRFTKRKDGVRSREIKELKKSTGRAARILGAKDVFSFNMPDNRFDAVSTLDIVKIVESIKWRVRPSVIYTHHYADLNIDHRVTYNAVITACRPSAAKTAEDIYSFEIPSSTEWNYPNAFKANVFVDITKTMPKKIEALNCYKTELRKFPHPRSVEAIRSIAKRWGSVAGLKCAEAFETIRVIER